MAIGATREQLLTDLRLELGHSGNPSTGQNYDDTLAYHLNAEYERLWDDFNWPHLWGSLTNGWFDKTLAAGQRYYDYPTGMDPHAVKQAWYKWGDVWRPVGQGISLSMYNAFDSDDSDIRSDPVSAWRQHTATQFEVWPIPATNGLTLRFEGKRLFARLVQASDVCYLDRQLVVLAAATKIKKTRKGENGYGGELGKMFRRHYAMCKRNSRAVKMTGMVPLEPPVVEQLPRISVARVEV